MSTPSPVSTPHRPPSRAHLQPNFDPVARIYRWAEYLLLGTLLKRTREHFLPQLTDARHALVLGDGDGRFISKLLYEAPSLTALAVDTSATMLHLLQARCTRAGVSHRLTTRQISATDPDLVSALPGIDLIVTHFFLDCLPQPEVDALARRLAAHLQPGCRWVISDFDIPRTQPWRGLAKLYIAALYRAFRLLTGLRNQRLPDPGRALAPAGFVRLCRAERLKGLLYSEIWILAAAPAPRRPAQSGLRATSGEPLSST